MTENNMVRVSIPEAANNIAKEMKEKYSGKLINKRGIRKLYALPYVRAVEIFTILIADYGFKEETRFTLRVP